MGMGANISILELSPFDEYLLPSTYFATWLMTGEKLVGPYSCTCLSDV